MRRRQFVRGIAGTVAAWPLVARAQQTPMPVIGLLDFGTADAFANSALAAFRGGLRETGYVEGQNVTIDYRFAENNADRLRELATDLVHRQVAVIVTLGGGSVTAFAAKASTSTIPIVIAFGGDPVKLGLVESLNHPGANITGVTLLTNELQSKRFEILCQVLPQVRTIAYLRPGPHLSTVVTEQVEADALATAHRLGRELTILKVEKAEDLDTAFATLLKEHADALFIMGHPIFDTIEISNKLVALTLRYAIPAIYQHRPFPAAGGLMSYGVNFGEAFRQAGVYAGRILKGEKPADLPFQQSTKVELVINLKTAKALGLDIPQSLLARADEIVE